jgi:outer membrane protein TolC
MVEQFGVRRALVALMFLTVGCSVGPRYKQPLTTLQPYHNAPEIGSSGALPAPSLDNWRTRFNDTELIKIVDRALSQNLDLAASFARVAQARAVAQAAGANRKPDFDLAGSNTASRQSIDTPIGRAVTGIFPAFNRNQNFLDLGIAPTAQSAQKKSPPF